MNLGGIQNDERPRAKVGAMYQPTRDSSASFRSFDPHPSSQAFRPAKRGARSDSDLNPVVHLSRIVESIRYSAVIEERNRLGCEIHDTLAQQFAGILLHLEAANGLELGGMPANAWRGQGSSPNLAWNTRTGCY